MSYADLNCLKAEKLAQSDFYKLIIIVKGAINAASVVFFSVYYLIKGKPTIFHPNTKIIYQFVCASLFLVAIHTTCIYFYEIYRMSFFTNNPCDRLWLTAVFFYLRNAIGNFLNIVNSSLIVMCIERVVCILKINNYEESSRPVFVVLSLIFLAAVCAIAFLMLSIPGVDLAAGLPVATLRNEENSIIYQIRYIFVVITELLGVFFFLFVHFWALYYKEKIRGFCSLRTRHDSFATTTDRSLSVKFQIEETLKITTLFLPMVVTKCIMQIISYLSIQIANNLWLYPTIDTKMIIYELANIWLIQSCPCILLLMRGSGRLKKMFLCLASRSNKSAPVVQSKNSQADYFDRLKQIFEKDAP